MNVPAIALRDVCRVFAQGGDDEVRALDSVSLTIPAGSFVVVRGPSGSGKTTLLMLLAALDRPTSGQVRIGDQDLARVSEFELARHRRQVGFVFQDFALLPRLSVSENITYPLIPRGWTGARRRAVARQWLKRLGLEERGRQQPRHLSGGERQRVAVARALAGSPTWLVGDEPTSNLDRDTRRLVVDAFRTFHACGGTVIVATHDPDWLETSTQLVQLQRGKLQSGGHVT